LLFTPAAPTLAPGSSHRDLGPHWPLFTEAVTVPVGLVAGLHSTDWQNHLTGDAGIGCHHQARIRDDQAKNLVISILLLKNLKP
jgi:hypothetical protein